MPNIQIWIGLVMAVGMMQAGIAADPQPTSGQPFQLGRMARSSTPGLHIRVVDASGAAIYPIAVAVEYDSGAPAVGKSTAEGFTAPAADGRKVRAITLGAAPGQQRFDVDPASANVIMFRQ